MSAELTVAVCLFNAVDAQDYQGPVELFGFVNAKNPGGIDPPPRLSLKITYLSSDLEYVQPAFGPRIVPDAAYKDLILADNWQQFDILLVPGGMALLLASREEALLMSSRGLILGPGARPDHCPKDLLEFIKLQTPNAKYVLSVCTGAWVLAMSGILDGKKATTNKKAFKDCKVCAISYNVNSLSPYARDMQRQTAEEHPAITWVAPARWVQDGNIWSSSGITAGGPLFLLSLE